jgi:hypothetical protein
MGRTGCVDVAVIQNLYRKDEVNDFVAEYFPALEVRLEEIPNRFQSCAFTAPSASLARKPLIL